MDRDNILVSTFKINQLGFDENTIVTLKFKVTIFYLLPYLVTFLIYFIIFLKYWIF